MQEQESPQEELEPQAGELAPGEESEVGSGASSAIEPVVQVSMQEVEAQLEADAVAEASLEPEEEALQVAAQSREPEAVPHAPSGAEAAEALREHPELTAEPPSHPIQSTPLANEPGDTLQLAEQPTAQEALPGSESLALLSEEDEAEKHNEVQLRQVLTSVLDDDQVDFSEVLKQASLQELVLLMEDLARREMTRPNIRKVGQVKKQFDDLFASTLSALNAQAEDSEEAKTTKALYVDYSQRLTRSLLQFNKRRTDFEQQQTTERDHNLAQKKELLDQLKQIVMAEEVSAIDQVRKIQERWRLLGPVPQAEVENVMQSYRTYLNQFYGLREKYNELLEQDRKVNQEEKEKIILEMEQLLEGKEQTSDPRFWQESGERVKVLHENWKAVGPVPREHTEVLWQRFKTATDKFYELRRNFFEQRDQERGQNAERKRELLTKAQGYAEFDAPTREEWLTASAEMKTLQDQWNQLGPTSAEGRLLFKQFRDLQNAFYKRRSSFFNGLNQDRTNKVEQKEELLKEAEALALEEVTDTHLTADRFKQLQRRWRETGPDDYKEARKVHKRFRRICDTFFNQLKEQLAAQNQQQEENLTRKTGVIDQLEQLATDAENPNPTERFRQLTTEWDSIGHVPFKQKDKLMARYKAAYAQLVQKGLQAPHREHSYDQRPHRERDRDHQQHGRDQGHGHEPENREERRINGRLRQLDETIQQYENNILFISKGKSGDKLRADINLQIEQAREEQQRLKKEIKGLHKPQQEPQP